MTQGRRNCLADVWAYVQILDDDHCWPWIGPVTKRTGRPKFHMSGREITGALAVLAAVGRPVVAGRWALHTCDNGMCVNPAHLYEGNHAQNMRDMVVRGRQAKRHPQRQLIPQERVTEVIARHRAGEKQKDLAAEFGVGQPMISMIVNGRRRI